MVGSAILRNLQDKGFSNFVLKSSKELDLRDAKAVADFFEEEKPEVSAEKRPGDWLENSPILSILIVILGAVWMFNEFSKSNPTCCKSQISTFLNNCWAFTTEF